MSRVIFPGKLSGETLKLVFDFTSRLSIGETISSATTTAVVYSGTDASPSAIISGAASISGTQVTQTIVAGTLGVTYLLLCAATTSTSQVLQLSGFLSVVPNQE